MPIDKPNLFEDYDPEHVKKGKEFVAELQSLIDDYAPGVHINIISTSWSGPTPGVKFDPNSEVTDEEIKRVLNLQDIELDTLPEEQLIQLRNLVLKSREIAEMADVAFEMISAFMSSVRIVVSSINVQDKDEALELSVIQAVEAILMLARQRGATIEGPDDLRVEIAEDAETGDRYYQLAEGIVILFSDPE